MSTTRPRSPAGVELVSVNGVRLACTDTGGDGPAIVLVHGSWGSHRNWDPVVSGLAEHFRVITYDRRGHSDSEHPPGQGRFSEDAADLAALIEHFGIAPSWVAGNSAGAVITLQLAASRPELVRGIVIHEPPMFGVLDPATPAAVAFAAIADGPLADVGRRIGAGDSAGAAEQFVDEVAFGPGNWVRMPEPTRATMIANAPSFLDELRDPEASVVDAAGLARYRGPVLLTSGDRSPPIYRPVTEWLSELLPQARRLTYEGAGHLPHATHPDRYVSEVVAFVEAAGHESFRVHSPDGIRLAVWVEGHGPPIVLVHGSIQDHTVSADFVRCLSRDFTTYSMDRRGFGASGDGREYTLDREFADVAAVVDAVAARAGGPVVLFGHSFGAGCALGASALTRSIRHLVLYEPGLGLAYPAGWIDEVERVLAEGHDEAAVVMVLRDLLAFDDDAIDDRP
ncbi:alpha/beta fold hydrolase [Microbacterium immunditiarum]|uniref:Pimeloyl-ACP methyl ester carboxylesterase n=1 Tax=Microbacterium immunditiarum TaxID=337480 RepID=A0A7Y9GM33_9MICO|nr:alpha/beta hydrolase [Microbacterium immunditiarum]NYE18994.1 pimeloyl-ACP methyl ester carboxylesterase [Microbacterium immunditiarum]